MSTKKSLNSAAAGRGSNQILLHPNNNTHHGLLKELTLDDARRLMQVVPADDRELWIKVGMALSSEFGDRAFPAWDDWSQTSDNYRSKDAAAAWRSFSGDGVGIGSLIFHAKHHGWTHESTNRELPPLRPSKPLPKRKHTGIYAFELWLAARTDDEHVAAHPYAVKKGISWAAGAARGKASRKLIGCKADCIIVPIYGIESKKVQGVQCINADGKKQTFGAVAGGCLLLGNTLDKTIPWFVAEGWASGVSMVFHHCKGHAVCAVSFGKSQLEQVAEQVAEICQPEEITILQEVDK